MLITYFDEVKYQPEKQPYQWLAGIIVDESLVRELEGQVGELAKECFGTSTLGRDTEFHAAEIYHRKGNFKSWSNSDDRIEVLKKLAKIIDRHDEIFKVYARLEPARMIAKEGLDQKTFMYFIERVDRLVGRKKSLGILIGDFDKAEVSEESARNLSVYRERGTPYDFGREIKHLIDTVHFTHSHLSRMLQLADIYVWSMQLASGTTSKSKYPRPELVKFLREETELLAPHSYKEWPTAQSRFQ